MIASIIAWVVAIALCLAFPLSEWARGMASSGAHPPSKVAIITSLAGVALIVALLR